MRDGDSLDRLEGELEEDSELEEAVVVWEGDVVQVCTDGIYLLVCCLTRYDYLEGFTDLDP